MPPYNAYLLENTFLKRILRKRKIWVNELLQKRKQFGEFWHIWEDLRNNERQFFSYFRMSEQTFNYILHAVRAKLTKYCNFRDPILPAERLAVTLRYLATGSSFMQLGFSFRIGDNTVGKIIYETCKEIWDCLQEAHMPFPSSEQVNSISNEFYTKWKFPNCVGCIDGKHIRIKNPAKAGSMHRNYKQYFSIVLQGLAGPDYKFFCIDVGSYGKESDGGIFANSNLSRQLDYGALNVNIEKVLPGTDMLLPHVILGDEAYPLKTYLMRPYPQRNLGPEEDIFNIRLSKARQVVECAFGMMSNKWRLLLKAIEVTRDRADVIVKCICLLHNIIIDKEGVNEMNMKTGQFTFNNNNRRFGTRGENRTRAAVYSIRDSFKTHFVRNS